VLKGPYR